MESLKHFHNIIYSMEVLNPTDDKNISHEDAKHTSPLVLCQCIFISQEYGKKLNAMNVRKIPELMAFPDSQDLPLQ